MYAYDFFVIYIKHLATTMTLYELNKHLQFSEHTLTLRNMYERKSKTKIKLRKP